MDCIVERDLNRYQGEVDADARRELAEERLWPDMQAELLEKLLDRWSVMCKGRGLICWADVCEEAVCDELWERAQAACVEDNAEGGRLMAQALTAAAGRLLETNKAALLDAALDGEDEA
jgi:hypothetical protein